MKNRRRSCPAGANLRLEPQRRLCPRYDDAGFAAYPIARPGEMGFRVVDDFVQEHIM